MEGCRTATSVHSCWLLTFFFVVSSSKLAHGKGHDHIISTQDVQNMVCPLAARSSHTFALVSTSVATWLKQCGPANKLSSLHSGVPIGAPKQIGELTHRLQAAEHRVPRVFHATGSGAADNASERLAALVLVVQRNQLSKGSNNSHGTHRCERRRTVTHPVAPVIAKRNEAMREFPDDAFDDQLDEGQINATHQNLCTALAEITTGRPQLSVRNLLAGRRL